MSLRKKHSSKKAGRRRRDSNYAMSDDDDEGSVISAASLSSTVAIQRDVDEQTSDVEDEENTVESQFTECLDNLSEKRATMRENALKGLHKLMCNNFFGDVVQDSQETLLEALLRCTRKGKSTEQTLALNALAVSFVQYDDRTREGLYNMVYPSLQTLVRDNSAANSARVAGLHSLGFACFIACRDAERTHENMELFEVFMEEEGKHAAEVCEAAVDMWALLLSTQPPYRAKALFEDAHPTLVSLLTHKDVEVRVAASEACAVLLDACRRADPEFDTSFPDEMDALETELAALTTDADKKRAKKDRSKQRSQVRGILRFVEDGEEPSATLKIGHEVVETEGWRETTHLNAVRDVLGSGLQQHLLVNINVRSMFGLGAPPLEALLNPRERHAMHKQLLQKEYAPREKRRTQNRALARNQKGAAQGDGDYD